MDILFCILFVALGFLFINRFKDKLSAGDIKTLRKLFLYHLIFAVYYYFFVFGDSIGHWKQAKLMNHEDFIYSLTEEQGTYFIHAFNYLPANVLGLSYFTGTLMYSLIGFIGLVYFYVIAETFVPYNSKFKNYYLFPGLFFLPNLHFWSCAVGKDTLLFFCIAVFMYGVIKPIQRMPFLILGLGLAYFVRPHMTLFMLLAYGMAYFLTSKVSVFQRVVFFAMMIGVSVTILPSVMEFAKIEEASVESFDEFSDYKSGVLSREHVGSAINISSYPFPLKVFTFLYRPLFFDINGIPAVLASFENLLLLLLTIKVLRNNPVLVYRKAPLVIQGMLWFLVIGTLAFSQSLGNVGIMIRMRNMFLPGLIIFLLWSFSYQKQIMMERKASLNQ
ncbi:hypothetical protein EZL74_10985 [Flavobacterium silvisoli]|uniref:Glycosyltransferase RgtA/B/C/D-like domain-containing protein n=1 Tax=Flavobacterium silvisoli TaxID=2529433 RepID=A0A4Q9YY83_9FLAO|nr:hypothetical protein [Flavobacterium silvisoli]TBX66366.1 hypothetical protein EZL74_10985 [Flavobacterium silvisoli]